MKVKSLKSVMKFWQEIIFAIALGTLIYGITINISVSFQHVSNIIFYCVFVLLLVCLLGQIFYWKSIVLALYLAVILGLGSAYMILAALSDLTKMNKTDDGYIGLLFGLFLFIGLTVIAISMPFKYSKFDNGQEAKTSDKEV